LARRLLPFLILIPANCPAADYDAQKWPGDAPTALQGAPMRTWTLLVLLAVCLAFTACSGSGGGTPPPPPPPTLSTITVAPSGGAVGPYTAFKNDTLTFVATGHYSDNSTQVLSGVTWSTTASGVATIDTTGKATAAGFGSTTIGAALSGVNGTATLTVTPKLQSIAIAVSPHNLLTIAVHTTSQFQAIGTYDDGSTPNLTVLATWTATGTGVATISNTPGTNGLATGNAAGTATIAASYTQPGTTSTPSPAAVASNNLTLTVTNATLTSMAITPASPIGLGIGFQKSLTCTGTFSNSTTQDITDLVAWDTNHSEFATVSASSGVVTGTGLGSATITASPPGWSTGVSSQSVSVTVDTTSVFSVAIFPPAPQIAAATNIQLRALATLTDGSTLYVTTVRGINWTSQNLATATIAAANGYLVSQGMGTSSITVDLGTHSATTSATVKLTVTGATISSVAVSPGTATIAPTTTQRFVATGTFSDTTTQDITDTSLWTSSTPAATITQTGLATAGPSQGSAQITAGFPTASPTKTGSAALTVSGASLSSISVTPANTFIPPAGIVQYTATGQFSNSTTQVLNNVTWSSDLGTVASIDPVNGLATGNGGGTANIKATLGSVSGTTTLLVTSSPLASIAIAPADPTIAQLTGVNLTATGTFQDGTTRDITSSVHWAASSTGNVATVGNSGNTQGVVLSTAVSTNTPVTITAALNGVSGSTTVTVTTATLSSIAISPTTPSISVGQTQQLRATGTFSDGSTQDLTLFAAWSSDTATVAVVDSSGLVTAAGAGSANITAAMNGQSNHITITVH
jgi:trimeric autotransporter adhesin